VQSLESKLRVAVVETETNHTMGVVSIPLKEVPFLHESMAFGLAKYYPFKRKSKDGTAFIPGGMLRIGLKLLKQRQPILKLVLGPSQHQPRAGLWHLSMLHSTDQCNRLSLSFQGRVERQIGRRQLEQSHLGRQSAVLAFCVGAKHHLSQSTEHGREGEHNRILHHQDRWCVFRPFPVSGSILATLTNACRAFAI